MEENFKSFNLGVSWSVFGNARESDLDDIMASKNIHGEARLNLVYLWKRHPDRTVQGIIMGIIVSFLFLTLVALTLLDKIIILGLFLSINLPQHFLQMLLEVRRTRSNSSDSLKMILNHLLSY
jgi:hypothetical protein